MKQENETIKTHYDDEEILIIALNKELEEWEKELGFLKKELGYLIKSLSSSNSKNDAELAEKLNELIKKNDVLYSQSTSFDSTSLGIRECTDIDCEVYFYNAHFNLQKKLSEHFEQIREAKLAVYETVFKGS